MSDERSESPRADYRPQRRLRSSVELACPSCHPRFHVHIVDNSEPHGIAQLTKLAHLKSCKKQVDVGPNRTQGNDWEWLCRTTVAPPSHQAGLAIAPCREVQMEELSPDALANFKATNTATVCGRLFRRGFRNVLLRTVRPLGQYPSTMVGPAYTLRFIPAREDLDAFGIQPDSNVAQREAFEQTPAGHVLVMDCREETRAACCGDILVSRLMVRGGAGVVTDGGVRDCAQIARMAIPVFAAAPSPPVNRVVHHALEHGRPIACGGVAVYPGDVVVGDADGVVIVPRNIAAEIAAEAIEQDAMEAWLAKRVLAGAPLAGTFPPSPETLAEYKAWVAEQAKK